MAKYQTITVLPGLSHTQRIRKIEGWVDCGIEKKGFPQSPSTAGNWECELVAFDFKISSKDAKTALEVDGWIVARGEHLLAYNETNPRARCGNMINIIALGSVFRLSFSHSNSVDGKSVRGSGVHIFSRCVLSLCDHYGFPRDTAYRSLGLHSWKNEWFPGRNHFLRVRKVQQTIA